MLQLIAPNTLPTSPDADHDGTTERLPSARQPMQPEYRSSHFNNVSIKSAGQDKQSSPRLSAPVTPPRLPSASARPVPAKSISGAASLPKQPPPDFAAQTWEDDGEESLLGAGVTMQFALPQRMGIRTRWLIAGTGLLFLAISAAITLVLNGLITLTALTEYGASSVLAALIIPAVPAIGIFLLVNFIDRFEREPWFLRLAAFLWGAIIAIPFALFVERRVDSLLASLLGPNTSDVVRSAFQGLNAGITEETIKCLGLLLLFLILRDEFDNVTDGIVYALLIGAGFAMVENFRYFAVDFKQFPVFLIVYRIGLGWLGHSTFTACFGAALGYVRHTRVRWRQLVIPLVGFLAAVGLHSFFDFVDFQASIALNSNPGTSDVALFTLLALIGDYIPPFLAQMFLLYLLIKSLAHEAAVIREFLAAEVSNGTVQVNEYALLQNSFLRTQSERSVWRASGYRQWLRVKALYQTEIGLAFRKWHVSMGDKPKLGYRQPEDAYRRRIKRLRYEIQSSNSKT
jgi:RsiW-degrading membrane proteinase PrsW (M82 family)